MDAQQSEKAEEGHDEEEKEEREEAKVWQAPGSRQLPTLGKGGWMGSDPTRLLGKPWGWEASCQHESQPGTACDRQMVRD